MENDRSWIPFEAIVNSSLILSSGSEDGRAPGDATTREEMTEIRGPRVGSAFLVTVPFESSRWNDMYCHTYVVTAGHCAYDSHFSPRDLIMEGNWMGGQGGSYTLLPKEDWRLTRHENLRNGEDWVDLACQRYRGPSYSGHIIGKSTYAVSVDDLIDLERVDYDSHPPLGIETVTVGLLSHISNSDRIEPAMLFGRLAVAPLGPIQGRYGRQESLLLVESNAAQGMSGAPVFVKAGERGSDVCLLGVHVGHFLDRSHGQGNEFGFAQHSRIGLVAPAARLHDLLYSADLVAERRMVEEEVEGASWRFLDPRHRQRFGVSIVSEQFHDLAIYGHIHPLFEERYLFINPSKLDGVGDWWNRVTVGHLEKVNVVRSLVTRYLGAVTWRGDRASGGGLLADGTVFDVEDFVNASGRIEALIVDFGDSLGPSARQSREDKCTALADHYGWVCISLLADERVG
jgi:hypothetical protein